MRAGTPHENVVRRREGLVTLAVSLLRCYLTGIPAVKSTAQSSGVGRPLGSAFIGLELSNQDLQDPFFLQSLSLWDLTESPD